MELDKAIINEIYNKFNDPVFLKKIQLSSMLCGLALSIILGAAVDTSDAAVCCYGNACYTNCYSDCYSCVCDW